MEQKASRKIYPVNPVDYILVEEVGQGVSAIVYRATCVPFNETVAVKVLDFERCNSSLDEIRREAQTMRLTNHPNILSAHCSFVVEQTLWVVMPYMAGGSFFHIMKSAYPDGFEEPVIATILRECLKGLEYLHNNGFIHRDVKAGNILVDRSGAVKLGDFGVSACMFDTGDRQRSWNTFAGTPCWMAPEVMEQFHGYDFKADIWSFGITALELAHGHAPFSKYPPMKVLLMTLQNAPPGLDYERDKRFSKAFKKLIAVCLVKEPSKRPSAEKLLKHSFFKRAHSHEFIARTILDSLPPLGQRLRDMKLKDVDMLGQNKMPFDEKEERSQNEYKRGISAWNFDVEDLKAQAALIQDDDESIVKEDATCTSRKSENLVGCPNADILQSPATIDSLRQESLINADGHITGDQSRPLLASSLQNSKEVFENMHKDDRGDNRVNEVRENVKKETNTHDPLLQKLEERDLKVKRIPIDFRRSSSGPLVAEHVLSSYHGRDEDKDPERKSFQCNGDVFQSCVRGRREHTFSGPLTLKGTIEGLERGLCVRRGRFSVTPEDVDLLEVEASDREQQLLQKLAKLQQRINSLEAELEATKLQNRHLEQQLNIQQTTRGNNNRGR